MTEMIERVAKVMWETSHVGQAWGNCSPVQAAIYREDARAAIEAMREPTQEMKLAAYKAWTIRVANDADIGKIWQAMIDAALTTGLRPDKGERPNE